MLEGVELLKTLGRHLIAEYYGCDRGFINDYDSIRQAMLEAARRIGATVVRDTFHRFAPQGISGSVVIAESHLSIHTWPESGYVAVDIYTCGGLDPRVGFDFLGSALSAKQTRTQEIVRGLPEHVEEESQWLPDDVDVITLTPAARTLSSLSN